MRVLWLAAVPSLYDEGKIGGWIGSLEHIVREYNKNITLGIIFEHEDNLFKVEKNGVIYYPVNTQMSKKEKFQLKFDTSISWKKLRPKFLTAIKDFHPDIIHCFGSEWPYGLVVNDIDVPIVIHMQGFLNVCNSSSAMAFDKRDYIAYHRYNIRRIIGWKLEEKRVEQRNKTELEIMKKNHYFMGRTKWDKDIVNYFSPDSIYYYCPEAIRPVIYDEKRHWKYKNSDKMQIVTISQAGNLKGNEIILRTADFLKNVMNFEFEWHVAGHKESFKLFEFRCGIKHEDVNIKLLGMISAEDVVSELLQAEVYVHPSIIDNSPNSLCEAQLIGTPVIATNVGGIPSLVENGKTGILYPYNEYQTLAFRLMELHCDKDFLELLSRSEISISHERHNPQTISKRIDEIYYTICENHKRSKEKTE